MDRCLASAGYARDSPGSLALKGEFEFRTHKTSSESAELYARHIAG